ncbi:MAG: DUF1566 domain-containing protein [Brachymonas sp.]|nr:DUF1566 domain-containing protein [Brachymonas sp.]
MTQAQRPVARLARPALFATAAMALYLAGCVTGPAPVASIPVGHTLGKPQCTFFDAFRDNGDGTVTDPRNGLVWKRCAEGYDWRGNACVGNAIYVGWEDAMAGARKSRYLNQGDWRLPTRAELDAVVSPNKQACFNNDFYKGQYAASRTLAHPVDKYGFPGGFWSNEAKKDKFGTMAWFVSFGNGFNGQADALIQPYRLVRRP